MTLMLKRSTRNEMIAAAAMFAAGVALIGFSVAELAKEQHVRFAQATPPTQSTPGADSKPSAPKEPETTGQRPQDVPPQPARPDADAQKAGAAPALPAAPAEKSAAPIPSK